MIEGLVCSLPVPGFAVNCQEKINSLFLRQTRGITPKHVTSGGAHLRGLALWLHSYEGTLQRWRVVSDTAPI